MTREIAQTGAWADIRNAFAHEVVDPGRALLKRNPTADDLSPLRGALLDSPRYIPLVDMFLKKEVKTGNLIDITTPSGPVRDLLLFFRPPVPDYTGSPINVRLPEGIKNIFRYKFRGEQQIQFSQKSHEFMIKTWSFIDNFKNPKSEYYDNTQDTDRPRFGENFQMAIRALVVGYDLEPRRTKELKIFHPIRTFMRTVNESLPFSTNDKWIVYTSHLAALLHDAKEDFQAEIVPFQTSYDLKFIKDGKIRFFPLNLKKEEVELLQHQIDALSNPLTDAEKKILSQEEQSNRQFQHLTEKVLEIQKKFGPLAAYYTLLIKFADRLDNLCTYWEFGKDPSETEVNLLAKLRETITHFKGIEKLAENLMKGMAKSYRTNIQHKFHSVVQFCYYLLLGGNYNEAFSDDIASFQKERSAGVLPPDLRRIVYDRLYNILIPTLDRGQFTVLSP